MTAERLSELRPYHTNLRAAGRRFLLSLRASNAYSDRYLESLEFSLGLLAEYAEAQEWPAVAELVTSHLEEYLVYLQRRPKWFGMRGNGETPSQSYIETQYRRLNRFFKWQVQREYIEKNPFELIPHPHVDQRTIPTVSQEDMLKLLKLTNPKAARNRQERFLALRNRAALYILFDTPSRRDEIAGLTMDSVDWNAGAIHVLGKGRKERWMTLDLSVLDFLWDYRDARDDLAENTNALWVSHLGKAMLSTWIYTMLKHLGERAGVDNLHTHRFRHTYAINALSAGMQERYLAFEGGWKKIPETYFRTLGPEHIAERHRELSPVARLLNKPREDGGKARRGKPRGKL